MSTNFVKLKLYCIKCMVVVLSRSSRNVVLLRHRRAQDLRGGGPGKKFRRVPVKNLYFCFLAELCAPQAGNFVEILSIIP